MGKSQTMIDILTVNSGRFLTLPPTAKLLYFYLLMYADDDGIVDAYLPMQVSHTQFSDLNELEKNKYVLFLEKPAIGYLPDYRKHNRNMDTRSKRDSYYLPLLAEKFPDTQIMVGITKNGKTIKRIMSVSQYVMKKSNMDMLSLENNQITEKPMEITGNSMELHEAVVADNMADTVTDDMNLHDNTIQHNITQFNTNQLTQHNKREDDSLCTLEDLKEAGFASPGIFKLVNAVQKESITKRELQRYIKDSKKKDKPMGYLYEAIMNHYKPL